MSAYADADYLVVKIYAASGTNQVLNFMLGDREVSHRIDVTEYDTWVEYKFSADVFRTHWANNELSDLAKIFLQGSDWQTTGCFYIADIRVEHTPQADIVDEVDA